MAANRHGDTGPVLTGGCVRGDSAVLEVLLRRRETGSRPGERRDGHRIALVISGGGMRGAYTGGMVHALEDHGLRAGFDELYATSAGAFNAAAFISGEAWGAARILPRGPVLPGVHRRPPRAHRPRSGGGDGPRVPRAGVGQTDQLGGGDRQPAAAAGRGHPGARPDRARLHRPAHRGRVADRDAGRGDDPACWAGGRSPSAAAAGWTARSASRSRWPVPSRTAPPTYSR